MGQVSLLMASGCMPTAPPEGTNGRTYPGGQRTRSHLSFCREVDPARMRTQHWAQSTRSLGTNNKKYMLPMDQCCGSPLHPFNFIANS
jgi:hypothetical protein